MGLFSRPSSDVDLRDRDYVLTGTPVVAQDDMVVLVDLTVRLAVRPPRDDRPRVLGYDTTDERSVHAVCVLVLRLLGSEVPSEELLLGRTRIVEAVEQALAFAPVGAGVDGRVTSVEVHRHDPQRFHDRHEFRIVGAG